MPTLKIHFKRHRFDESQSGENTVTDAEQELEKQKREDEIPNEMDDDGIRWFLCKIGNCDYKTKWKSNLKPHIIKKHEQLEEAQDGKEKQKRQPTTNIEEKSTKTADSIWFNCPNETCKYKSKWKGNLNVHIRKQHSDITSQKILQRPQKRTYRKSVSEFDQDYNPKSKIQKRHSLSMLYKCKNCGYRSAYEQKVLLTGHNCEKKYKCDRDFCSYETRWNSDLCTHIRKHHS